MALPSNPTDREYKKFTTDENGNVAVRTTAILEAGDIEIGAVEIKNSSSDDRATVTANGDLQVTLDGESIDVTATDLDIRDLTSASDSVEVEQTDSSKLTVRNTEYGPGGNKNYYASVSLFEIPAAIIADPVAGTLLTIENGGAYVTGDEAHDSADAGNPVKIGGKVIDYTPDTEGEQGPTDVASGDRANTSFNLKGELVPAVKPEYNDLDNIGTTYDDDPTTAVSSNFTCWQYRECCIGFELDKVSTPTDILFEVEISLDGTNFIKYMNGPLGDWRYSDVSIGGGVEESITFPIACQLIRVRVTATGTDVSNTFTVANPVIYFRT